MDEKLLIAIQRAPVWYGENVKNIVNPEVFLNKAE